MGNPVIICASQNECPMLTSMTSRYQKPDIAAFLRTDPGTPSIALEGQIALP